MAARVFFASHRRPIPLRPYATAAALAADKPASKPRVATPKTPAESAPSRPRSMSMEEQVEDIDRLFAFGRQMPTLDVWGQKVDTLDVIIPHPVLSHLRQVGFSGLWSRFRDNRWNDVKNMLGLYALASTNSIPGVITTSDPWYTKWFLWPLYAFTTQSTTQKSWLATCRRLVLDSYKNLNTAIAKSDTQEIKRLATDNYLLDTLAAQKKKRLSGLTYVWRFHREVNPTQIVSLRVIEGYLSPDEPKFGSRSMVHALVKFDTEQSLEIYDQRCNPLHKPAQGAVTTRDGMIEAEKQRVIQYLVMEKRMWYHGPWLAREQIWDVNAKKTN